MKDIISKEDLLLTANTIRGLAMDGVQKANSGHPGAPMGLADVSAVLWLKHLKHCPEDPAWPDRDRFVLSGGHASMLIYSMLHLSGYDLPITELQQFRQWDSKTPGHPEYKHTPGVETTTGPLGQGCGNAAGMALAERMLAERFNTADEAILDHYTYMVCGDGDMMEGISHEAFALAGHLKLNKLICFYDSNHITIEGSTDLAYTDNVKKRFEGYNFRVLEVDAHDIEAVDKVIAKARREKEKPVIIICHSHIAYGSPKKHDTASAHGEPLGEEEVKATKTALGMPADQTFYVPEKVKELFAARADKMKRQRNKWNSRLKKYLAANAEKAELWRKHFEQQLPVDIESLMPVHDVTKPDATRNSSGKAIQALAKALPYLVGGAADLAPSTKTLISGGESVAPGKYAGRNLHFGIREHGMAAVLNGMALHGGLRVYGSTFFVFADYMRPSMRLAALMGLPVIYVFTHDSFFVGEDGPTHEPVEHLASLRCIMNLTTIRPADPTEANAAWIAALKNTSGPTAILFTRQNLNVIDRTKYPAASSLEKGAYTLWQSGSGNPDVIIIGTGSEVELALGAARELAGKHNVRVVSMPSWELYEKQSDAYKAEVLPPACTKRVVVEAGSLMGWEKYIGQKGGAVCMNRYGASAPYKILCEKFGFTVKNVVETVQKIMS